VILHGGKVAVGLGERRWRVVFVAEWRVGPEGEFYIDLGMFLLSKV